MTDAGSPIPAGLDATLVLVRHGESTWVAEGRVQGGADPPLSPLGLRQAALVADRLADPGRRPALPVPGGPPAACWHSPLRRAAATADAIAGRWASLRPTADGRLREIGQGEWEGLTGDEVRTRYRELRAAWRRDPVHAHAPGGESLQEVDDRARAFAGDAFAALRASAADGPGSSGPWGEPTAPGPSARPVAPGSDPAGPGRPWGLVVAHDGLLRVLLLVLLELPLQGFWRFPLGLCGLSVVEIRAGRAALVLHNSLEHLAPLGAAAGETPDRGGAL